MNPFAFGENSDFLISAHQINALYRMVSIPMQDLGDINHLLLPHTIFKLTSKGKEMVFWRCIFRSVLEIVTS